MTDEQRAAPMTVDSERVKKLRDLQARVRDSLRSAEDSLDLIILTEVVDDLLLYLLAQVQGGITETQSMRGCICPPGAEKGCQGLACPRQGMRIP